MMSPVRRSIMCGSTSCTFFITTLTFKFSIRSIAAVSASTRSPPTYVPALAWKISIWPTLLQDSRHERSAVLGVEEVDDQRRHGVAMLLAERLQRRLVAVDHHHARAERHHRLGAGQSDARRGPGHDGELAFQFPCHSLSSLMGASKWRWPTPRGDPVSMLVHGDLQRHVWVGRARAPEQPARSPSARCFRRGGRRFRRGRPV